MLHGEARGSQWGLPTANIHLTGKPVVVSGVYVVQVLGIHPNPIPAVASVGKRPMFDSQVELLEVHLLDFNRDIYGRFLEVEFLHKLRDQQIFKTTDELISQIHQDIHQARQFFNAQIGEIDVIKGPKVVYETNLPLPLIVRGKVRDIYAIDDNHLLIVTTDRLSAFDIILADPIPNRGKVLTQISAFWFEFFEKIIPHHLITLDIRSMGLVLRHYSANMETS